MTDTNAIITPEAANTFVQELTKFLGLLYGLPGYVLVCLSCIVVGYIFKLWKNFPNTGIPAICVAWGMIFNPLIATAPQAGTSVRVWLVTNTLVGMVVGGVAWVIHNTIIKRFESKIPVLGPLVAAASQSNPVKP
jgi:hypothetical protein